MWLRNARSFLEFSDERVISLRYEDLVQAPSTQTAIIWSHLGLVTKPDDQVFKKKVRASSASPIEDEDDYLAAARVEGVAETLRSWGYR
jgi:hypothetical protein